MVKVDIWISHKFRSLQDSCRREFLLGFCKFIGRGIIPSNILPDVFLGVETLVAGIRCPFLVKTAKMIEGFSMGGHIGIDNIVEIMRILDRVVDGFPGALGPGIA